MNAFICIAFGLMFVALAASLWSILWIIGHAVKNGDYPEI